MVVIEISSGVVVVVEASSGIVVVVVEVSSGVVVVVIVVSSGVVIIVVEVTSAVVGAAAIEKVQRGRRIVRLRSPVAQRNVELHAN